MDIYDNSFIILLFYVNKIEKKKAKLGPLDCFRGRRIFIIYLLFYAHAAMYNVGTYVPYILGCTKKYINMSKVSKTYPYFLYYAPEVSKKFKHLKIWKFYLIILV